MKKLLILLVGILLMVGCSNDEKQTENDEKATSKDETNEEVVEEKIIELGGLTVYVPEGYEATGGHEGYRYVNAIITPPSKNYEIEVPQNYAHVSSDYASVKSVREHYTGAIVTPLDTEGWRAPVLGYTYVRVDDDFSSFTDFQPEHGASQIIGLFYEKPFSEHANAYTEVELRVFEGEIEDYFETFVEFVANNIDWDIDDLETE